MVQQLDKLLDKMLLTFATDGIIIRINNCRKHSRNEHCMQKHLHDHYASCKKDFLNTISVTFIDKIYPCNPQEIERY